MKITREQFKNIVREVLQEESEYQAFFKKALEKTGKSIPDMSDDEKKAFFNKIDAAWSSKGEKKKPAAEEAVVIHNRTSSGNITSRLKEEESVNEDYNGPAILKLGDKNLLKVGEKITINTNGKKKEYKVVKSVGNGDFVLNVVE